MLPALGTLLLGLLAAAGLAGGVHLVASLVDGGVETGHVFGGDVLGGEGGGLFVVARGGEDVAGGLDVFELVRRLAS